MSKLFKRINKKLLQRNIDGRIRSLKSNNGKLSLVDFSSNDYLGLSRNRLLWKNIRKSEDKYFRESDELAPVIGSTGSRLLTGNSKLFEETEKMIAKRHNRTTCLIANSGWDLNFGLLSSLPSEETLIVYDELLHNSMLMGIKSSKCVQKEKFFHNDINHLKLILQDNMKYKEKLILVESIYSMDGDECPIKEILEIAEKFDASVIIDEAHSTGVIGRKGEGLVGSLGLQNHNHLFASIHTFGKALGYHGAAILTNHHELKDFLLNYCSPIIYSTSLSFLSLICIQESYKFIEYCHEERAKLEKLIKLFKEISIKLELILTLSSSAIQGVIIKGNERVLKVSNELEKKGFNCLPIRSPTVKEGNERLRIVLHSFNSEKEIEKLCFQIRLIMDEN